MRDRDGNTKNQRVTGGRIGRKNSAQLFSFSSASTYCRLLSRIRGVIKITSSSFLKLLAVRPFERTVTLLDLESKRYAPHILAELEVDERRFAEPVAPGVEGELWLGGVWFSGRVRSPGGGVGGCQRGGVRC